MGNYIRHKKVKKTDEYDQENIHYEDKYHQTTEWCIHGCVNCFKTAFENAWKLWAWDTINHKNVFSVVRNGPPRPSLCQMTGRIKYKNEKKSKKKNGIARMRYTHVTTIIRLLLATSSFDWNTRKDTRNCIHKQGHTQRTQARTGKQQWINNGITIPL